MPDNGPAGRGPGPQPGGVDPDPTPGTPEPRPLIPGPPKREGSPAPEGVVPGVHGAGTGGRRSMQLAMVALLGGVLLASIGAGQAWARVRAAVELPGIGAARLGGAELTGNDLQPFGAVALLGLVLLVAVAATRGRGRWPVGLALLTTGVYLSVGAAVGAAGVGDEAAARVRLGQLDGVPGGAALRVATPRAGPVMVVAGGLLLAAAGAEALRRGARWPALGEAFRAPPDRVQPATDAAEPPWEGD